MPDFQLRNVGITDFGDLPVFEAAAAYPMIFVSQKCGSSGAARFTLVTSLGAPYPDVHALTLEHGQLLPDEALDGENWRLYDAASATRLRTMTASGIPLGEYVKGQIYRGVLTGFNAAFVIDGAKRAELIAADPGSEEIIKPLVVGRDIKRWTPNYRDRWPITTKIDVPIRDYPAIFAHLQQWEGDLERRYDKGHHWWELRACSYYDAFDKPKIIYPQILVTPSFAYDETGTYTNQKCFILTNVDCYPLGMLNSSSVFGLILSGSPGL